MQILTLLQGTDTRERELSVCGPMKKSLHYLVSKVNQQSESGSLKTVAELFCAYYGIKENGNVDPHQVVCNKVYKYS